MMTKWYRRNRAGLQRKGTQEAAARMDAIRARVASAWDHTRSEYWISERKKEKMQSSTQSLITLLKVIVYLHCFYRFKRLFFFQIDPTVYIVHGSIISEPISVSFFAIPYFWRICLRDTFPNVVISIELGNFVSCEMFETWFVIYKLCCSLSFRSIEIDCIYHWTIILYLTANRNG